MVPLRALHPRHLFAERAFEYGLGGALVVVLVFAFVSTAVIGAVGYAVSEQLDETVTVENEARPPESTCDAHDEKTPTFVGCGQPETKTFIVGDRFWSAFVGYLPLVFVGSLLAWPLVAAGLHLVSAVLGGEGSFLRTLVVAGWGMAPAIVQALVGGGLLLLAVQSATFTATDPQALVSQFQALETAHQLPKLALGLVFGVVQAWVWAHGLVIARNMRFEGAAIAAGVIAAIDVLLGLL